MRILDKDASTDYQTLTILLWKSDEVRISRLCLFLLSDSSSSHCRLHSPGIFRSRRELDLLA